MFLKENKSHLSNLNNKTMNISPINNKLNIHAEFKEGLMNY